MAFPVSVTRLGAHTVAREPAQGHRVIIQLGFHAGLVDGDDGRLRFVLRIIKNDDLLRHDLETHAVIFADLQEKG